MTRRISRQTTLDNLKKEAKRWLKELRANDGEARARFERATGKPAADAVLRDVQHALALEFGMPGWTALTQGIEVAKYEQLADDMVAVYATGDTDALRRVNAHYNRTSTVEDVRAMVWRRVYKVRQADGAAEAFGVSEAQELIASTAGFNNWGTLTGAVSKGLPPPVPPYAVDAKENRISPRRLVTDAEWDMLVEAVKERGITTFEANGMLSDAVMPRIAGLEQITNLRLGGCRELSDDGLQLLARMPQLEHLDLSEYPGGKLTDRGLEVLKHLPNLRSFQMCWQKGITDAGIANLRFCDKLESVNVMGTPTGDGVIEALRGKSRLRRLDTGRLVTDAGLAFLREYPLFAKWHPELAVEATGEDDEPTHLLIDGPFTNQGIGQLAGLDGVYALDLFWHVSGITTDAFEVLPRLANLGSLGCDGALSDDVAMGHIGAIPRLRKLRAQGSTATDDGYVALSKSQSLEKFWGREAPNLTGRGFVALANMPLLRSLGVSCKGVDDDALASLPQFPSLRHLTPIDVLDAGFRHVGQCRKLDNLWCMYCRDTTDIATEHIAGLTLTKYYAGLTQITDRSLEILGKMATLESVELYQTPHVTDAGLVFLAGSPRLREMHLSGCQHVTYQGTKVFPGHVRVEYNV